MYELKGTSVLVHPEFDDDPAQQQGKIGMIATSDLDNDDFYVSFGQGKYGRYRQPGLTCI